LNYTATLFSVATNAFWGNRPEHPPQLGWRGNLNTPDWCLRLEDFVPDYIPEAKRLMPTAKSLS
jgi:hypothetical protein